MKTNDIKITQRAEYYYTTIDLFQTVHQNRRGLGGSCGEAGDVRAHQGWKTFFPLLFLFFFFSSP